MMSPAEYDELTGKFHPDYLDSYMAAQVNPAIVRLAKILWSFFDEEGTGNPPPFDVILAHKLITSPLEVRSEIAAILESAP